MSAFEEFLRGAEQRRAEAAAAGPTLAAQLRELREQTERRYKVEALLEGATTEGERDAALAALRRMDAEEQRRDEEESARIAREQEEEEDFLDALHAGEI